MAERGTADHNQLPSQVGPLRTDTWGVPVYNATCKTFAAHGWGVEQTTDGLTTFKPGDRADAYSDVMGDLVDELNQT